MKKLWKFTVAVFTVTLIILVSLFTYTQSISQPPILKTLNWSTAQSYLQEKMPVEYKNVLIDGKNVTIAVQLNTPYGNISSTITFLEQVTVLLISNSSQTQAHIILGTPTAYVDNLSLGFFNTGITVQNHSTLTFTGSTGLTSGSANLPGAENVNVTVQMCSTFGPYWIATKTLVFAF